MKSLSPRDSLRALANDLRYDPAKWFSRFVFLLGPWAAFAIVEFLNETSLFEDFREWQVLMNMIWYYLIFIVCRLVLGRRRRAAATAILLCSVFGLVNHYILRFRGRILFPADIPAWKTAANVASGFDYSPDMYMEQAFILLMAYLFLVWACPAQKKRDKMPVALGAVLCLFTLGYSYAFFFTNMLPNLGIYTQQWNTQKNGFMLNFTIAAHYMVVQEPEGYSDRAVADLMDEYTVTEADDSVTKPTNIIVIMNEAFSDLTIYEHLEATKDPTPFLHSMTENTIKGLMYAPVTGGGTASTEFEFTTGFSNSFLPPHCVAYQLYMTDGMSSIAQVAKSQGYDTTAFHPYLASGWNRPLVYRYLDFNTQLFDVDVTDPKIVRQFISDETSYDVVASITDAAQGDPAFILNVTMQNHSGYALSWTNLPYSVGVSKEQEEIDSTAKQYLSLMYCSDQAIKGLIEHYEQSDENTLIVFFGDHQPSLSNAFYESMYGKKLSERTREEILQQYAVPFFIWANYDIPEQEDVILSANFLQMLTAKTAGLDLSPWMSFMSELYEHIPVICSAGYITADGTVAKDASELTEEQQEWLAKYEMLCYAGLMDPQEDRADFFRVS